VLVVSHSYEPLRHVSAKRPSRMARELCALGFDVTVLTVDWRETLPPQPAPISATRWNSGDESCPRVMALDPRIVGQSGKWRRSMARWRHTVRKLTWLRRARTFAETVGWGSHSEWARLAYDIGLAVHASRRVDVIWAIHGDNSAHEIAHQMSRAVGTPWVADFKDPWSIYHHRGIALWVQEWATARRLSTATSLTETCAAQAREDEGAG